MSTRRIVLICLNAAGGLGLLFSTASNLWTVPSGEPRALQTAPVPSITGAVTKQEHEPAGRILFDPVQKNSPNVAESAKPPFRLVGIVSQNNESFAVVQIDERNSVRLRLNEQIQGWRLAGLRRSSARFTFKSTRVEIELVSPAVSDPKRTK